MLCITMHAQSPHKGLVHNIAMVAWGLTVWYLPPKPSICSGTYANVVSPHYYISYNINLLPQVEHLTFMCRL